jgi:hypothetical protein
MGFLTLQQPAIEPVTPADLIAYGKLDPNESVSSLTRLLVAARLWCEAFCERAFIFQTKRLLMDFFPGYVDFKMAGQRVSSPFVSGSNAVLVGIRYAIALPWPSVRQVVKFQYQDANGNYTVMRPGADFTADIDSQPARLTPIFGQMWPVARVIVNAVQVDYVTGYAGPIMVGIQQGASLIDSPFLFLSRDIGSSISIPNADVGGKTPLVTTITAVDSNGRASIGTTAGATAENQTTNFGNVPEQIQLAILALAYYWFEKRIPDTSDIPDGVKVSLWPYRDCRM